MDNISFRNFLKIIDMNFNCSIDKFIYPKPTKYFNSDIYKNNIKLYMIHEYQIYRPKNVSIDFNRDEHLLV